MKPTHKITDTDGIWAILPSALAAHIEAEIRYIESVGPDAVEKFGGIVTPAASGAADSVDVSASVVRLGGEESDLYTLRGNIAMVPISGTLTQKGTWRSPTTYAQAAKALKAAAADPRSAAVLALIDSPGGTVAGVTDLVDAVREVAAQKPLYAYTDGVMTSGAYWPMASVRKIGAVSTAQVGSIGVLTAHEDISKMLDRFGVKLTFLTSGRYKAMGNFAEPLTEDARAYIQDRIDAIYSLFLADVAAGRSLSTDTAERWADGRVFPAAAAVEAGLVDRVESLNSFISFIQEDIAMKPSDLKAQHPDTYRDVFEQGVQAGKTEAAADVKKKIEAAEAEGIKTAINQTVGIVTAMFGQSAADKLSAVLKTGVTADQFAAMKAAFGGANADDAQAAANADADSRRAILDGITAATPAPVTTGAQAGQVQGGGDPVAEFEALIKEKQSQGMTRPQAHMAAAKERPDLNSKWLKAQQK